MSRLPGSAIDDVLNDIEEESEELEPRDSDLVPQNRARREVVTSVVEYSLASLFDVLQSGRINLSPRYQRRGRWDPIRQSRLIEFVPDERAGSGDLSQ